VKTLVWGSMLALLLKRYVAFGTGLIHRVMISTQKVARCSNNWIEDVLNAMLKPKKLLEELRTVTAFLAVHGKRAHLKRDRKTLLLSLGLEIYPVIE
jgi:hypothetical protein